MKSNTSKTAIGSQPNKSDVESILGPIDSKQLKRIESVHRGFLYQHLFAVACLIMLGKKTTGKVRIEGDEDVEIITNKEIVFVQVKTRSRLLVYSDIKGALERFDQIRSHYRQKMPDRKVKFVFLSNEDAGAHLQNHCRRDDWPKDVFIVSPGGEAPNDIILPPAWRDLDEAILWCTESAENIPFRTIHSKTLVWKLAASVQFAATGQDSLRPNHIFNRDDLPSLFEQFTEQLQEFPVVPDDYRPQVDEPHLDAETHVRLVVGFSGAGKSVWASWQAQHCSAPTVYFDVGNLPGSVLISSLARELVARFLGSARLGAAQMPAVDGVDLLRALDKRVSSLPTPPIVVIDNIHRIDASQTNDVITVCQNIKFILLAQPWPDQSLLEILLNIKSEELGGWDSETIASVFMKAGSIISPNAASQWRLITAGMPLFIKNAADLSVSLADGDATKFFTLVERGEHAVDLAQETLLRLSLRSLSDEESTIVAALSLASVPLAAKEVDEYLDALPIQVKHKHTALRSLQRKGFVQLFANSFRKLHDAMRLAAADLCHRFSRIEIVTLQTRLRDLINPSNQTSQSLTRFGAWIRLLPPTGEVKTLVDLATSEYFHEFGEPTDLKRILISVAYADDTESSLRFWTLDALILWQFQESESGQLPADKLKLMEELVNQGRLGDREQIALIMKRIVYAGKSNDLQTVNELFEYACKTYKMDSELDRIARYNYAVALYHCGSSAQAHSIVEALYIEYYDVLDLSPADIINVNPPEIVNLLSGDPADHQDSLKHLADCLNLAAMCLRKDGEHPRFTAIHAAKFYHASLSYRSAMKAAQDVADDFLAMGDKKGARGALETLVIPILKFYDFTSNSLDVRAQYAVVLAHCGQIQQARAEMTKLDPYLTSASPLQRKSIANQRQLIEKIADSYARKSALKAGLAQQFSKKLGRNQPCPCGSGQKYKKCCLIAK